MKQESFSIPSCMMTVLAMLLFGTTSVRAATVQSGPMDGSQIDQVGEQVMNSNEFRSVRRTVLEKLPESDVDKGFLGSALRWVGDWIGDVFGAIGNFFRWLFSGFSGPGRTRAPVQPVNSPAGSLGMLTLSSWPCWKGRESMYSITLRTQGLAGSKSASKL